MNARCQWPPNGVFSNHGDLAVHPLDQLAVEFRLRQYEPHQMSCAGISPFPIGFPGGHIHRSTLVGVTDPCGPREAGDAQISEQAAMKLTITAFFFYKRTGASSCSLLAAP